jgi:hypothetical protein
MLVAMKFTRELPATINYHRSLDPNGTNGKIKTEFATSSGGQS